MSYNEVKEHIDNKNNFSKTRKVAFGVLGAGLCFASALNSARLKEDDRKIEELQRSYIENVCSISPEFERELEDYYLGVNESFESGEITQKEAEKMIDTEVVYDLAKQEDCKSGDLNNIERQIKNQESIRRDRVAGKYFGLVGGIGMLCSALSKPALKLIEKFVVAINERKNSKER